MDDKEARAISVNLQIRTAIIEFMTMQNGRNEQCLKHDLLEYVACVQDCRQSDVSKVFTQLKKEGIGYCVIDLPGWVGIHPEKLNKK
jgi:hypothetical protein